MEKILSRVQVSIYMVVPSRYTASIVLNTDGTLIDGCAGFAIHKISNSAGIFTAKVTALFH
jgi:hypothetical protein